ncbi:chromosomal replication initiator protein DnaA [Mycoplasma sp. 332]|uniref:chromosomal replication initiator protein DnaA n=1 Tax=unclassified Asterococcus (in: mycoplasmas, genus) TaxID=3407551 RepID=UPI003F65C937
MKYQEAQLNLNVENKILQNELKNNSSDEMVYETFFSRLQLISTDENNAYILAPTYIIDYVKQTYLQTIQRAVINTLEKKLVVVLISSINEIKKIIDNEEAHKFINSEKITNVKNDLTFSNYFIGNFNKITFKAVKQICNEYNDSFNPLFIYSSSGLGKTHLLHAIGNEFKKKNKTCLYINPDNLTRKLVEQLKSRNQEQINKIVDELTSYDCLMFDDVQQYGNKESTLNVLFNIINTMKTQKNQIIFCADKQPNQLGGFEQRFLTRFEGGLITEINDLSVEDVISILKFKLKENDVNPDLWEEESFRYIARNFSSSIRALEGAISRIKLFADGDDFFTYDLRTIQNIFKNVTKAAETITPEKIIETVSKYYGIDKKKISSPTRVKEVVMPRKIVIYLLKHNFDFTLKEIGKIVGDQAHSTVIASLNWVDANLQSNSAIKTAIEKIQNTLKKVI